MGSYFGDHIIERIYEIAGDVSPSDFPLTDDPPRRPQLSGRPDVGLDDMLRALAP